MKQTEFIANLSSFFSSNEVTIEAMELDDFIRLDIISVKKEFRNQGFGSKIMKDIVQYANNKERILLLFAQTPRGATTSRLKNFYKRFGFIENKGKNHLWRFPNDNMYKLPDME